MTSSIGRIIKSMLLFLLIGVSGVSIASCAKNESASHSENDGHDHDHGEEGHKHVDGEEK